MRQRTDDTRQWYSRFATCIQLEKMAWIPVDNDVFNLAFPPYVEMNPAGAVDVLLPAVTAKDAGKCWLVSNISANTITFKTAGDAAFTTAIVLATLENTLLFATGSTTAALGWRALGTALSS